MQALHSSLSNIYYSFYPLWNQDAYKNMSASQIDKLMKENKIDINTNLLSDNTYKETVLSYAIKAHNEELVRHLCSTATKEQLDEFCCIRSWGDNSHVSETPVNYCLNLKDEIERVNILKILLQHGSTPNRYRILNQKGEETICLCSPLLQAESLQNAKFFALLFEHGVDPSYQKVNTETAIKKLWKEYRTAFTAISTDQQLPKELLEQIKKNFIETIGFPSKKAS